VNGETTAAFEGSVSDLLVHLEVSQRGIAVALNGAIIPRSEWTTTIVPLHGSIEIVTAAAGG
jgi:sulfur carrier protein